MKTYNGVKNDLTPSGRLTNWSSVVVALSLVARRHPHQSKSGGERVHQTLDGGFAQVPGKEFPTGSFYVDMAQSMANAAFYYLEPQARDGFVGWWVLDEKLKALGAGAKSHVVYPIFKVKK